MSVMQRRRVCSPSPSPGPPVRKRHRAATAIASDSDSEAAGPHGNGVANGRASQVDRVQCPERYEDYQPPMRNGDYRHENRGEHRDERHRHERAEQQHLSHHAAHHASFQPQHAGHHVPQHPAQHSAHHVPQRQQMQRHYEPRQYIEHPRGPPPPPAVTRGHAQYLHGDVGRQESRQHLRTRHHVQAGRQRHQRHDNDEDSFDEEGEEELSDGEMSAGSDVSGASRGPKPRGRGGATRALREMAADAQQTLLEALAGPESAGENLIRKRRIEVRRTIGSGCTNCKTDFWESKSNGLNTIAQVEGGSFSKLKEHQRVGVRWLMALHGRIPGMILADEMGLGKTLQTLCFLELLASSRPTLIVAPVSLLETWVSEAARWTPQLTTLLYHSNSPPGRAEIRDVYFTDPSKYRLVLTTPQSAHNKEDQEFFFRRVQFEYLVVDEAHSLKNSKSARYKDLAKFVRCHGRLLLTGTPVQNCLAELATLLGFALSDRQRGSRVSAELDAISEEPLAHAMRQLQSASAPLILRRLKMHVLTELPAKKTLVVNCQFSEQQKALYDLEVATGRRSKLTAGGLREAFFKMRRLCLHPLLARSRLTSEQVAKFIDELMCVRADFRAVPRARVEQEVESWSDFEKHKAALEYKLSPEFLVTEKELLGSGKVTELLRILGQQAEKGLKTLVFSQFTQYLDIVEAALNISGIRFLRFDGNTAIDDRRKLVSMFQSEGGPLVFLISLKSGGVGLTLTAANYVVMLDLDFNPQNSRQAEDRVHRLGQTREVFVHYLVCRESVEEMVLRRNIDKMQLDQQFGGRQASLKVAKGSQPQQDPRAALSEAADPAANDEAVAGEAAEAEAKKCEKEVLSELKQLLGGKGKAASSSQPEVSPPGRPRRQRENTDVS